MPDDELLASPPQGKLATAGKIRSTAPPDDGRSAARKRDGEYSWRSGCGSTVCSASRAKCAAVPDFRPSLLAAMMEETRQLFNHLVWGDQNFMELFSADYTFISARLARLYGLPSPRRRSSAWWSIRPTVRRAGVLGHGGFLT